MGNMEKLVAGSHKKFLPSNLSFDNGVDSLLYPTRYVVWSSNMTTSIHPDYVLVFRLAPDVRGKFNHYVSLISTTINSVKCCKTSVGIDLLMKYSLTFRIPISTHWT